ncbi:MAG: GC-type dockerin domain-anchored protein, partial [Cyanobacteria bacterium J06648_11]
MSLLKACTRLLVSGAVFISPVYAQDIPCRLCADTNGDGNVDSSDYFAWVNAFNNNDPIADQNFDGVLDTSDYFAWVTYLGQGQAGPTCPAYSAGCPGIGVFVAEEFLTTAPVLPVPISTIDGIPTAPVVTSRGSIVDAQLFGADAIADIVIENRLVSGDDPAENPPAGQVDRVREESSIAALHIVDSLGVDKYFSARIVRCSSTRIDESTGSVVLPRDDHYDRVHIIGRYQTFADAVAAATLLSETVDLELANPVPLEFPEFGDVVGFLQ